MEGDDADSKRAAALERKRATRRAYRERNKEHVNAVHRAWRAANKDRMRAKNHRYYEKNKKEVLARQRIYNSAHREEQSAKSRKWHSEHKEYANAQRKRRAEANPEQTRATNARMYAKHRERMGQAMDRLGGKCAHCGITEKVKLQFNHIDPETKLKNVSQMQGATESEFLEEVAKCEILCCNCHILHTWFSGAPSASSQQTHIIRHRQRVAEAKEKKGNKCDACGHTDTRVLQFVHLRDRLFSVGDKTQASEKEFWDEVEKTVLLCCNCKQAKNAPVEKCDGGDEEDNDEADNNAHIDDNKADSGSDVDDDDCDEEETPAAAAASSTNIAPATTTTTTITTITTTTTTPTYVGPAIFGHQSHPITSPF
jgi:hypothetical protein